jgi:hypothetical protein
MLPTTTLPTALPVSMTLPSPSITMSFPIPNREYKSPIPTSTNPLFHPAPPTPQPTALPTTSLPTTALPTSKPSSKPSQPIQLPQSSTLQSTFPSPASTLPTTSSPFGIFKPYDPSSSTYRSKKVTITKKKSDQ